VERGALIQVTPQMRVLVAIEPVDFRKGIDGLARIARDVLARDPFSGSVFVFRNRRATAIKVLVYDSCEVPGYVVRMESLGVAALVPKKMAALNST
jgi:transposase